MIRAHSMKIDLKQGFLDQLKAETLRALGPEERAVIEVSTGEMGNKPDAVKLGWLKMRTGDSWTKQRYQRALKAVLERLAKIVAAGG
ncbi:MAG TPA: hypothetical protein VMR29_02145 [Candidatus Binatia bacterium]|nr:hypothetical protein [Candidatus Binatia bacterium]